MKEIMCITSNQYDRNQYKDHEDIQNFYTGLSCNGLELLVLDDTSMDEILTPSDVTGVHLPFVNCWVDFWKENTKRLFEEYGDDLLIQKYFGGLKRDSYTEKLRQAVRYASGYEPEYLVYHISECTAYESVSNRYYYTDEEVIDASADFINSWCDTISSSFQQLPWLLLENLWHSGLNLQNPAQIRRLLDGIHYPKTGIMLDIGHLLHCNPDLYTIDEAVDYLHQILDSLEDLSVIKGIHLHQTLRSDLIRKYRQEPLIPSLSYKEKQARYFPMVYQIDAHEPFPAGRISEVIQRIQPSYLVHEILTSSREEYAKKLKKGR